MRLSPLALLALPALTLALPTAPAAPRATPAPAPATDSQRLDAILQLIPTEPAPSPAAQSPPPSSWDLPPAAPAHDAPTRTSWFGPRGGSGGQKLPNAGGPRQLEEQALTDNGYDVIEVFGSYLVLLFVFST